MRAEADLIFCHDHTDEIVRHGSGFPPQGECVSADGPTSGFVDNTCNCPISIDSFEKIRDYETSPKPFRIAGLVIIVVGIGTAGAAGAAALRRRSRSPETSQG